MNRSSKIYIVFFLLFFLLVLLFWIRAPRTVDWRMSLSRNDKIPFGTWVLDRVLPKFLKQKNFIINAQSLPEVLPRLSKDSLLNLIILGNDLDPDPWEMQSLLQFAKEGNTIFISAFQLGNNFYDSLHIRTDFSYSIANISKTENASLYLTGGEFNGREYVFNRMFNPSYFSGFDSSNIEILGTDWGRRANFILLEMGTGKIYLHSQPAAFTNYHLLYGNPSYAAGVFSYLPKQMSIWDEYYKPRQFRMNSLLNFVLKDPSLKLTYYLIIAFVMIYFLTESKRRQRKIPLAQKLDNTSAEFAKVLGALYYQKGDHAGLAIKKYKLYIEEMRNKYLLPAGLPDELWMDVLSSKSKIDRDELYRLINKVKQIEARGRITEKELATFSALLEEFKNKHNL